MVTTDRVAIGQRRHADVAEFPAIETRYGVPRDILLGVWALESGFGSIMGDNDTLRALATLAAQGRRRAGPRARSSHAEDHPVWGAPRARACEARGRARWATPSSSPRPSSPPPWTRNGDGRRDIWGSRADALASAANLLAKAGWVRGQTWAREVTAPAGFDFSLTEGPRETPAWWAAKGVKRADGLTWSATDAEGKAQLVAPAGAGGPLFLLFPNHFALRQYNNSLSYALGVGLLADRFGGLGPTVRPWPQEQPLSLVDRLTAQRALAALGFDPGQPDGVVGMGTRKALREWQKARGLTADGYLSADMVRRLREEGSRAAPAV